MHRSAPDDGARVGLTEVLFGFQTGGSERVGAAIAEYAVTRGVPTSVCSTHGGTGPIARTLEAKDVPCEPLQAGPGGRVGRAIRLFRHLRRHRTAVLHVQHFNILSVVRLPARLAGVRRIVVTEHTDYHLRRHRKARSVARRHGRKADAVTVVHEALAEYLVEELDFPAERVTVIPNGVDTRRFTPAAGTALRRELRIPDDRCLVGSVGRLHPDKDPVNLVRGIAAMQGSTRQDLHAVIVGDGPCAPELERCIAELGLRDSVSLLGEREDIPELLRELDVFVLPSRTEGLPVALLEAMSCGLPVIATAVGGVPSALGDGGLTVPPAEPRRLAEALERLCSDPALRRRLGENARRRAVERFDSERMYRDYAAVLSSSADLLGFGPTTSARDHV